MGYTRTRLEEATERVKEKENEQLKAKLEEAERACAEMRDALRDAQMHIEADNIDWARFNEGPDNDPNYHPLFPEIVTRCEKALATDAGKGWKSPAQYDALKAKLEAADKECEDTKVAALLTALRHDEFIAKMQQENETLIRKIRTWRWALYDACGEIEKLPASDQETKAVAAVAAVAGQMQAYLFENNLPTEPLC